MTVELRAAVKGEVEAVLELWREAGAEPSHTDDAASLERLIKNHAGSLIVAVDGDAVVGSIIAGWDGWRGSIYRLVVAPPHRRKGLGRALLAAAERRLDRLRIVRASAIVVASDAQAMGFWGSSGWTEQVERSRFVRG